jgi:Domain of unknown function (DUF3291)
MKLAQLNISRLVAAKDHPTLAEFMDNLDLVNRIAERSPGFVWRLKDETGPGATDIVVTDDPRVIVNMSVWESVEALEDFVWNTLHEKFYRKRNNWFEPWPGPHLVMWWLENDHMPTLADGLARLALLQEKGGTEDAFGWQQLHDAKLWQSRRCA